MVMPDSTMWSVVMYYTVDTSVLTKVVAWFSDEEEARIHATTMNKRYPEHRYITRPAGGQ